MTDIEVLQEAIRIAVNHGLTGYWADRYRMCLELGELDYLTSSQIFEHGKSVEGLIYDHEFAEALWGDKFINPVMRDDTGSQVIAIKQTAWRHHLRQMVVADNPLEYLKENLPEQS